MLICIDVTANCGFGVQGPQGTQTVNKFFKGCNMATAAIGIFLQNLYLPKKKNFPTKVVREYKKG